MCKICLNGADTVCEQELILSAVRAAAATGSSDPGELLHAACSYYYMQALRQFESTQEGICIKVIMNMVVICPGSAGNVPAVLGEVPTPEEAFLGQFPSLNPLSAALLASVDLPMRELICLPEEQQAHLCSLLPSVPERSLRLFWQHCSYGTPTLSGRGSLNHQRCKASAGDCWACLTTANAAAVLSLYCITMPLPLLTSNRDDGLCLACGVCYGTGSNTMIRAAEAAALSLAQDRGMFQHGYPLRTHSHSRAGQQASCHVICDLPSNHGQAGERHVLTMRASHDSISWPS